MIIRILTEGQFQLPGAYLDELNALDNQLVEVVAHEDRESFTRLFGQMIGLVREHGAALPPDDLHESDLILPAPDSSLEEVEHLFAGEGLIAD